MAKSQPTVTIDDLDLAYHRALIRASLRGLAIGEVLHVNPSAGEEWLRSHTGTAAARSGRRYSVTRAHADGFFVVVRATDAAPAAARDAEDLIKG